MKSEFRVLSIVVLAASLTMGALLIPPTSASIPIYPTSTSVSSEDVPAGTLRVVTDGETVIEEFPLKRTTVQVNVSGYVAEVEVQQEYVNPFEVPIEAVYIFPLPHGAAVYDMEMQVGERTVRADIKRREEARDIYEQAKQEGKRTSLLEQERPNVFTQSVANILPGDEITIVIRYTETLKFDKDHYEFVFPMVVGPRYIPGEWLENNFVPSVTDFSRINPPVVPEGFRSGNDIELSVELDTGTIPITNIGSVTHEVNIVQQDGNAASISIREGDTIPNKDFVLDYELGSNRPNFALFTNRPDSNEDGFFTLMLQPQTDFTINDVTPKEVFFLVDASGSMGGRPIETMKDTMRHSLKNLNPEDSFYLAKFSNFVTRFSEGPKPATPENVFGGLRFIDGIDAGGGTKMLPGILEVLRFPRNDNRLRIVVVMSDGLIGNETQILDAIEKDLGGQSRLFAFGIGSSQNRYLLDSMARIGQGASYGVSLQDDTEAIVQQFYDRMRSPLFTDILIDWGEADVKELYPALLPDLFAGQPIYIHGRYSVPTETTVTAEGRIANVAGGLAAFIPKIVGAGAPVDRRDELFEIAADFPESEKENEWVGRMWARAKIRDLNDQMFRGEVPAIVEMITEIGLEHRLSTKYTSFVAVEETPAVTPGGEPVRIDIPVGLPEGTTYDGFFGMGDVSFESAAPSGRSRGFSAPLSVPGLGVSLPSPGSSGMPSSIGGLYEFYDFFEVLLLAIPGAVIMLLPVLIGLLAAIAFRIWQILWRYPVERRVSLRKVVRRVFYLSAGVLAIVAIGFSGTLGLEVGEVTLLVLLGGAVTYGPYLLAKLIAFIWRRIRRSRGVETTGRRAFWIVTMLGYLSIVGGMGILLVIAGLGESFGFVMPILRYVPPIVAAALLLLGFRKKMAWQRVLQLSLIGLGLWFAYRVFAILYAMFVAPNLFSVGRFLSDPRMYVPALLLAATVFAMLSMKRGNRRGFIFGLVVAMWSFLQLLVTGIWPLTVLGWPVLSLVALVSFFFLRNQFVKQKERVLGT